MSRKKRSRKRDERARVQRAGGSTLIGGTPQEPAALEPNPIKRFFGMLGPGFITGASDDDPSGIGTYATAGASLGFATLWTALVTFPMMAAVQFICAKIGLVCGCGLAGVLRRHYSRWLLYPVVAALTIANTINAGTDIGAFAAAVNLLVPIPISAMIIPIAAIILAFQIWGSYRLIARVFKWLTLALLAYIGAAFFARPDWKMVLQATVVPTLRWDTTFLITLVAILGTTISPYLFFWQASEEVEEERRMGRRTLSQRRGATDTELKYAAWDVDAGMFFSIAVMYSIMLATGATLHAAGKADIKSAADAAQALRPLAGDGAAILLAVGLIGTGFLAVPILTGSAAYAVSEAFGWKASLDEKPRHAKGFYAVIVASTLVGLLVDFCRHQSDPGPVLDRCHQRSACAPAPRHHHGHRQQSEDHGADQRVDHESVGLVDGDRDVRSSDWLTDHLDPILTRRVQTGGDLRGLKSDRSAATPI